MVAFTPLYGLPYVEPTDKPREIAAQDKAAALKLEEILLNQGQPPIGSDLTSLLKRLAALESGARANIGGTMIRSTAQVTCGTGAWNAIMDKAWWTPEQPLSGIDFDGRMTVKTSGMYRLGIGVKLDATANVLFAAQKNTTTPGVGFILVGSAAGTASYTAGAVSKPVPLLAGDKIGLTVFTNVATGLSNNTLERASTFLSLEYIEPIRSA